MKSTRLEQVYAIEVDFLSVSANREWLEHPEQRLLFAILERAARDFLGNQARERSDACAWLFDEVQDESHLSPFSFEWICDQLSIAPESFRSRLQRAAALVSTHTSALPHATMPELLDRHTQLCQSSSTPGSLSLAA